MSEAQLLSEVLALCAQHHVLAFHSTDARRDTGLGFPDLVIAGRRGVLFAELKTAHGSLSPHQTVWKYSLISAGEVWILWRPEDLLSGAIERAIKAIM